MIGPQFARAMATKLYVGNLPDSTKDKDLRELFQAFGEVEEVAVLRGYGFVVSSPLIDFRISEFWNTRTPSVQKLRSSLYLCSFPALCQE